MATTTRVVIADRDPALRRILSRQLADAGHTVHELEPAGAVPAGLADVLAQAVVIELDVSSERYNLLEKLRASGDVIVIALLPVGAAESEAFDALDAGADAVVMKPFSPREVISKLHAILRRTHAPVDQAECLSFDGLVVDRAQRRVLVDGRAVDVAAREFDLLVFLAESPRQVFTRREIMRNVWGSDSDFGQATVTEHVRRLRLRTEVDPRHPRYIQTVRSIGYRFGD